MARGVLSGMIAGTVVSGLAVATASVLTEVPVPGKPEATALEVPAGSEFDHSRDDTQASLPASQQTPAAPQAPKVEAPVPDDLSMIDADDTVTAAQPETGDTEVALNTPSGGDRSVGVNVDTDSPVLPSPQSVAPEAPKGEDDLSISTQPAQPSQPDVPEEATAFPAPELADPATPVQPEIPVENPPAVADPAVTEPGDDQADQNVVGIAPEILDEAPDQPHEDRPEKGPDSGALAPSGTITNLAPDVTTDRLPSIGAPPAEDPVTQGADDDDAMPALKRFATDFENPDDKPLMSIVLIDDGTSPIGVDALSSFPYPLSFAVDAAWPGAREAMRKYRAAGFEVLAMIDLPASSTATDTEVAMQALLAKVPEAVAVMEGQGTGLQSSRAASAQLAPILLDSGHGAVMLGSGLNTAQKLMAREGVPSASVFRDFDAKGQNAMVIRRFLDQAAFRATQEDGGVIMVGRLRGDTISALLLWGLQDRADRIALAPVSAVLQSR